MRPVGQMVMLLGLQSVMSFVPGILSGGVEIGAQASGRYQIGAAFTGGAYYVGTTLGLGTGSLGYTPDGGAATWAQVIQFDIGEQGEGFGLGNGYELELNEVASGGRTYSVYVAAGPWNLLLEPVGSTVLQDGGIAVGGLRIAEGLSAQGLVSISSVDAAQLGSFMGGVNWAVDRYLYVTLRPDQAGSAGGISALGASRLISDADAVVIPADRTRVLWSEPTSSAVLPQPAFTQITSDVDRIYVVWVTPDRAARVAALDLDGVQLSGMELLPPGTVKADSHHCFSIGVDRDGYLHVAGDMHNGNNRTDPPHYGWNYWISSQPRNANAFDDFSTNNTTGLWGDAMIGGSFATYANFFRDRYGKLWLTARVRANNSTLGSGLGGFRGAMLAWWDEVRRYWQPVGARAPADGNSWPLPVIAWDPTGRAESAASPDEWYQAYRVNLDFDEHNHMHLSWVAWGSHSAGEGAPYANTLTDADGAGATHLCYLFRDDATGAFSGPDGLASALPASRWDAAVLHANPGNLNFSTSVTTMPSGSPVISYWRGQKMYAATPLEGAWQVDTPLPGIEPDVSRQIVSAPDGTIAYLAGSRLYLSQDGGASWTRAFDAPFLAHFDKARFRQTGQLIGLSTELVSGVHQLRLVEINPFPSFGPIAVADNHYVVDAQAELVVPAPGVMTNDYMELGSIVTVQLETAPAHGNLTLNSNGGFSYTPTRRHAGKDAFSYRITDQHGRSAVATASIHIIPPDPDSRFSDHRTDPWQRGFLNPLTSNLTALPSPLPFAHQDYAQTSGSAWSVAANGTRTSAFRLLDHAAAFPLHQDNVRYFSFLVQVKDTPTIGERQSLFLCDRFGDPVAGFVRFANNRITAFLLSAGYTNSTDSGQSGQTFNPLSSTPEVKLVVMKWVLAADGQSSLFLRAFTENDTLVEPSATGPGAHTWSVHTSATLPNRWIHGIQLNVTDAGLAFSSFRSGSSFASVLPNSLAPSSFPEWMRNFPSLSGTQSCPSADPDADQRSNLIEYALDSNPLTPDSSTSPSISHEPSLLRFAFLRARTNLDYTVLTSHNLIDWTLLTLNPGSPQQHVSVSAPLPAPSSQLFFQLQID